MHLMPSVGGGGQFLPACCHAASISLGEKNQRVEQQCLDRVWVCACASVSARAHVCVCSHNVLMLPAAGMYM